MSAVDLIYVLCNARDHWLTKICVASIRHWYPERRLVLIKDLTNGPFDTSELERAWKVTSRILDRPKCGWGFAKVELLIRPQRERFLILDSDTVVCGSVLAQLESSPADFVVTARPVDAPGSQWFKQTYYDFPRIHELDPHFVFPGFAFNTGVYVATSGILRRQHFDRFLNWGPPVSLKYPDIFACADQGVLNFLLTKLQRQGDLTLEHRDVMLWGHAPEVHDLSLAAITTGAGHPVVIHYAGKKSDELHGFLRADILAFFQELHRHRSRAQAAPAPGGRKRQRDRAREGEKGA